MLARSSDIKDRHQAVDFLGFLRYRGATPFLIRLIHERAAMRIAGDCELQLVGDACESLGRIDTREAHTALKSIFETCPDFWTRYLALDAMGYEVDHSEPEYVVDVYRSKEHRDFHVAALWVMVEQSSLRRFAPYESAVIEALSDQNPEIRALALDALGRSGESRLRNHAVGLFKDRAKSRGDDRTIGKIARFTADLLSDDDA